VHQLVKNFDNYQDARYVRENLENVFTFVFTVECYYIILYFIILYHIVSYHIVPYRIILYYIISYHI